MNSFCSLHFWQIAPHNLLTNFPYYYWQWFPPPSTPPSSHSLTGIPSTPCRFTCGADGCPFLPRICTSCYTSPSMSSVACITALPPPSSSSRPPCASRFCTTRTLLRRTARRCWPDSLDSLQFWRSRCCISSVWRLSGGTDTCCSIYRTSYGMYIALAALWLLSIYLLSNLGLHVQSSAPLLLVFLVLHYNKASFYIWPSLFYYAAAVSVCWRWLLYVSI